jgi:hypothetical protein
MYLASPAAPTFKIKQSSSRTRVGQDARQQASLAAGFQALRTGGAPLARLLVALASPPRVSLAPHTCRCVTDAWWGVRHPAGTWHLDVATRPSFAGCRSSISSKASSAVYRRERRSMGSFSTMAPAEVTPRPWSPLPMGDRATPMSRLPKERGGATGGPGGALRPSYRSYGAARLHARLPWDPHSMLRTPGNTSSEAGRICPT